ncbi:hypothetical protein JOC34_002859 [Virgibacillus halotolerans]|uniref:hypothetical protein n=1 Tax=Virgibacillus halotolerans TaxID=1071053 RepID=UPI00195FE782|nr:hypothetical protein [Virgibacillus halotolerans]MBM7600468.1 hypothetical protein [Virgibacillus halotolerans]
MRFIFTLITIAVLTALAYGLAALFGSTYEEAMLPLLVGFVSAMFANSVTEGGE